MTLQEELLALERELQGINVELDAKRPLHKSLSIAITHLEGEREQLLHRIRRIRSAQEASHEAS
jgi:hypothetical protein